MALSALIAASPEGKVNVRSFKPESYQGNEFIYGLDDARTAMAQVRRLASLGLYVILNETVDVNDGGVSGVAQGSLIEFAPRGTPRVVDTGRAVSVRLATGIKILESVYGFSPELPFPARFRVEFSIHPVRRGWRHTHTIIWELEELIYDQLQPNPRWPNDFSEFIGDKVFGLLIAFGEGYDVPYTIVLSRHLPPFSFGLRTETDVNWVRTAPGVPAPGRFTTVRGWTDPFRLLAQEDPDCTKLSSVLIQNEVTARYSGALLTDIKGSPIIEGVPGYGDALMLGNAAPAEIPDPLRAALTELHGRIVADLGSIRMEWVFDGNRVWVLQLQQEAPKSDGTVIVDGDFRHEIVFKAEAGLEELRELVEQVSSGHGAIRVIGNIGVTSHMADVLRRANVPSRLVRV